jgi:hypothetical protein
MEKQDILEYKEVLAQLVLKALKDSKGLLVNKVSRVPLAQQVIVENRVLKEKQVLWAQGEKVD